jgi:hypothetical protein
MTRHQWPGLILATLLLATGWTQIPQAEGVAVVGQVTNGTPGGTVPADLVVTLHVFSGTQETATHTTTPAADGSFRFDGLTPGEGETLVVRVVYRDVTYLSEFGAFEPGQQELSLPVTIYEITGEPAAVLVTQLHMFVSRTEDHLEVAEYYRAGNTGDRTYVGIEDPETGRRTTLHLTLPEGAMALQFDGAGLGERFLEQEDGFADTYPIPPGDATVEVFFSYELPYREGQQVERAFDVPVDSIVLVIPQDEGTLEGKGLTPAGALDTQMGPALSYTAGPLAAGESLAFSMASPAAEERKSRETGKSAIGLTSLVAAIVVAYLLWRSPAQVPIPAQARPLVEAIAALDARFETHQVEEEAYHRERSALKRQVRALLADQPND